MAKFIREKVSKNKRRYKKDGFDLDLTYITERIVAMGFPSVKEEAYYRNPLPEVQKFYEHYHPDHYKLYNLCAEREYDITKFHSRVSRYPFYDHNAPPVNLIQECCKDVADWLGADEKNVVGINCKAGKGRTGLIICCYLLHSGLCKNADEAMKMYGQKRTKDGKGVTIASQIRYIRYYERILNEMKSVIPTPPRLKLVKIVVTSVPLIQHTHEYITIEMNNQVEFTSPEARLEKKNQTFEVPVGGPVEGDCRIQLVARMGNKKIKLCHFWFNTGFVETETDFVKSTIDVANKDKKSRVFKPEFSLKCVFDKWTSEDEEKYQSEAKKEEKVKTKVRKTRDNSANGETSSDEDKSKTTAKKAKNGEKKEEEERKEKAVGTVQLDTPKDKEGEEGDEKNEEDVTGRKRNKSFYSYQQDYKQLAEAGVFEGDDDDDDGDEGDGEDTQSMDITSQSSDDVSEDKAETTTTTSTTSTTPNTTSTTTTSPTSIPSTASNSSLPTKGKTSMSKSPTDKIESQSSESPKSKPTVLSTKKEDKSSRPGSSKKPRKEKTGAHLDKPRDSSSKGRSYSTPSKVDGNTLSDVKGTKSEKENSDDGDDKEVKDKKDTEEKKKDKVKDKEKEKDKGKEKGREKDDEDKEGEKDGQKKAKLVKTDSTTLRKSVGGASPSAATAAATKTPKTNEKKKD